MAACWTHHFEPDKSPPFQSLKCLGCCSFTSTALHCTGTAGWDWTGWRRRWAWLPSERASKAVELLRCAPGLPGPFLTTGFCPLSTVHFKFLLTGSPRQFQPAFPPLLPRLDSVISLFPLSSLHLERISGHLDNSASHFTSTPPFVPSVHHWDGPCSKFLIVWTSLIDRFLVSAPRAIP